MSAMTVAFDDPTVRRGRRSENISDCQPLSVANLYALRSTRLATRQSHPDSVLPDNDGDLLNFARARGDVVCAWRSNAKPEHAAWSCPMPAHASGVSAQPGTVRPDTRFTFAQISHQSNGALRIIVAAIAASLEKEDKA